MVAEYLFVEFKYFTSGVTLVQWHKDIIILSISESLSKMFHAVCFYGFMSALFFVPNNNNNYYYNVLIKLIAVIVEQGKTANIDQTD